MDLSLNSGFAYPYCTSREITVSSTLSDVQVHPSYLGKVCVSIRTFPIRVGNIIDNGSIVGYSGPFYPDSIELSWEDIGVEPELTTITKRERRVATFSYEQYNKMMRLYKPDYVLLNFANYSILNNKNQFKKKLKAVSPDGQMPVLVPLKDVEQQARFVAQRILELRDEGVELNQIGVLYRAHFHSLELQVELTRRNIPFQIRSGLKFFEQAHIKDIISYLKIIQNPHDQLGWVRVLRLYPNIGKKTISKIWNEVIKAGNILDNILSEEFVQNIPTRARKSWKSLVLLLKMMLSDEIKNQPAEQIRLIVKRFYEGYAINAYENYSDRLEDLEQLSVFASGYDSTETFLTEISLQEGVKGETMQEAPKDEEEKIILSTIHRAKGLEWQVVFIIHVAEYFFPSAKSLEKPKQIEEERRLFYVASTRAKRELYITYATISQQWDGWVVCRPSQFIQELPKTAYEKWEIEEDNSDGYADWYS